MPPRNRSPGVSLMQNPNNQNVIVLLRIKNHVALVRKTSVAGADVFGTTTHLWVIGEQSKALVQIVVVGLGLQQAKIKNGLILIIHSGVVRYLVQRLRKV